MPATKAEKTSYLLRDIPPDLWARVHRKASLTKGLKIRSVILERLQEWAADSPSEPQTNDQGSEQPETPLEESAVPEADSLVILF